MAPTGAGNHLPDCDKYYYHDPGTQNCFPCNILCEPTRGRQNDCEYLCSDYVKDNPGLFSEPEPLNCGPDHYQDEAVYTCVSCAQICDPTATTNPTEQCLNLCQDYAERHFGTATTQSPDLDQGHSDHSSPLVFGLVAAVVLLLVLLLIGVVIFRVRWRRQQKRMLAVIEMTNQERGQTAQGSDVETTAEPTFDLEDSGLPQCARRSEEENDFSNHEVSHQSETHPLLAKSDDPKTSTGLAPIPSNERPNPARQRASCDQAVDSESLLLSKTNLEQTIEPTQPKQTEAGDPSSGATPVLDPLAENTRCKEIEHAEVHASFGNTQREFSSVQGRQSSQTSQSPSFVVDGIEQSEARADATAAKLSPPRDEEEDEGERRAGREGGDPQQTLSLTSFQSSSGNDGQDTDIRMDGDPATTEDDSQIPVVNLVASLGHNGGAGAENEPFFAWDVLPPQGGASRDEGSSNDEHGPSTADYEYLDKQKWVRIIMRSSKRMEIMVEGIAAQEARRNILENTDLHSSRLYVTTLKNSNFRYLDGGDCSMLRIKHKVYFTQTPGSKTVQLSTIAGFLDSGDPNYVKYLITSGHHTSVGIEYYSDPSLQPAHYLGKCKYQFCCPDEGLDCALIELENMSRKRLSNLLSIPYGDPVSLTRFQPRLSDKDVATLERNSEVLIKHSVSEVRGKFAIVITYTKKDHKRRDFFALNSEMWRSGTCSEGDSGSLITAMPGRLGCKGRELLALGVVTGLHSMERKAGDKELTNEVCTFSSLWRALEQTGEDLTKFRFIPPIARIESNDEMTSLPPTPSAVGDSGYPSTAAAQTHQVRQHPVV